LTILRSFLCWAKGGGSNSRLLRSQICAFEQFKPVRFPQVLILTTFDCMKSAEKKNYPSMEGSIPFNGILSVEQIRKGERLFLKRIQQDKRQAQIISSQKTKAGNLEASTS
jgi:hypothetical protein